MSKILQPAPGSIPLPRQSIFHYLFPEVDSSSQRKAQYSNERIIPSDAVTFIDAQTDRTLLRRDVLLQAQQLAGGLRALGLKKGDVVGVIGMNSLEWLNSIYGSLCAGLRISPINYA